MTSDAAEVGGADCSADGTGEYPSTTTRQDLTRRISDSPPVRNDGEVLLDSFSLDEVSRVLKETGWTIGESIRGLIDIATSGNPKEQIAARIELRRELREVAELHGLIQTQKAASDAEDSSGNRIRVSSTQSRLVLRLRTNGAQDERNSAHATAAGHFLPASR